MRRLIVGLLVSGFLTAAIGCGGGAAKTVPAPKIEGATGEAPAGDEPKLNDEGP